MSPKGGKQPGAGRPPAPPRPAPMSWRPDTFAQVQKFKLLGGARWLKRMIDQAPNPEAGEKTHG